MVHEDQLAPLQHVPDDVARVVGVLRALRLLDEVERLLDDGDELGDDVAGERLVVAGVAAVRVLVVVAVRPLLGRQVAVRSAPLRGVPAVVQLAGRVGVVLRGGLVDGALEVALAVRDLEERPLVVAVVAVGVLRDGLRLDAVVRQQGVGRVVEAVVAFARLVLVDLNREAVVPVLEQVLVGDAAGGRDVVEGAVESDGLLLGVGAGLVGLRLLLLVGGVLLRPVVLRLAELGLARRAL